LGQSSFARYTFSDDGAVMATTVNAFETGFTGNYEHNFDHDSVGVEGGGSYLRLERVAPIGAPIPSRFDQQLNPRGSVVWRHDITRVWSANADAGLVWVHPVGTNKFDPSDEPTRSSFFPIFGGVVAYTQGWGRVVGSVRRSVAPNQYIAENTVDDS